MERLKGKWGGGEVLKRAVRGMLPKNRLRDVRMERLKCFEGEAHPYGRNVVRSYGGQGSIGRLPEVQATLKKDGGDAAVEAR